MTGTWYWRRGRIDRRTYWLHYALPLWGATIAAAWADIALGTAWYAQSHAYDGSSFTYSATFDGGLVTALVSLALFAPSISSAVCRLHDRGHSGWFLLWGLVPFAGPVVLLVTLGFLPGEPGRNRYSTGAQPAWREPQPSRW